MILIILAITALASLADVLLKTGARQAEGSLANPLILIQIPWIWLGAFAGITALAMWVYVLSRHHISYAYPIFIGLTFLGISLASNIILDEAIGPRRAMGIALVLIGIVVVHLNSRADGRPAKTGLTNNREPD